MKAIHFEQGHGNLFDNMLINLPGSYAVQDKYLETVDKDSVQKSRIRNFSRFATYLALEKMGLYEAFVDSGVIHDWFDEFHQYWRDVLQGRPLTIQDFHQLRFLYRTRAQHTKELQWRSYAEHLQNWQSPEKLYLLFHYVYSSSRNPIRSRLLWKMLRKNMRVVEFGCSLAPMYRTWKRYLSHIDTTWVLADIANFPFHYARHIYASDKQATLVTIREELFDEPLKEVDGTFDLIIIQAVFEHLPNPRYIAEYLIQRLSIGGLFYFDFVSSEGKGLDTPSAAKERLNTLNYIESQLGIVYGNFHVSHNDLGGCVGMKTK